MTLLDLAAVFATGVLLVVVGFVVLATYNGVVALEQRVDKAWANVEVALTQRWEQLPNLVEAVRDVMTFERELLLQVTQLRAAWSPRAAVPDQAAASQATSGAVRQLLAVAERYPVLQSNRNALDLQDEIERLENVIAARRELYNDQVYRLNTRIGQVPALFLAPLFGWRARPFFDAEPAAAGRPDTSLAQPS